MKREVATLDVYRAPLHLDGDRHACGMKEDRLTPERLRDASLVRIQDNVVLIRHFLIRNRQFRTKALQKRRNVCRCCRGVRKGCRRRDSKDLPAFLRHSYQLRIERRHADHCAYKAFVTRALESATDDLRRTEFLAERASLTAG